MKSEDLKELGTGVNIFMGIPLKGEDIACCQSRGMAAGIARLSGQLLLVEQLVCLFLNQFVGVSKAYLPGGHVHQSRSHNRVSELLHMGVEGNRVWYPDLQIV